MSTASKSPRKVAAVALEIGRRTLPAYGHRYSRKDFTLPQLFACLVLRKFFKTDYRGIVAMLADMPALRADLGLAEVPHFTTLQKQEQRLLGDHRVRGMLTHTLALYHDLEEGEAVEIERAAADSTGFETDRCSRYFVRRRSRERGLWQTTTYRRFAKLGLAADCENHLILATHRPRKAVGRVRMSINCRRCSRGSARAPCRRSSSPTRATTRRRTTSSSAST